MRKLKENRLTLLFVSVLSGFTILISPNANAQEEWEPQTFVTGYVNTIAEFTDQPQHQEINKDIGIGLSEVGFLVSYKPIKEIELKSTLVWKHSVADLQSFLVEAYGIYTFSDKFKVGVGKFLAPLSPVNTYFYAPLNPSVVLPMVISHHVLTPQSIGRIQLSGQFGNDFLVDYNITYGTYATNVHIRSGIINLMGNEDQAIIDPGAGNGDTRFDLGGSTRLAFKYDFLSIGLNYFDGTRATSTYVDILDPTATNNFITSKWAAGIDFHLNFNDKLKLNAEYWDGENETIDDPANVNPNTGEQTDSKVEYDGYYVELLYTAGKFTPYLRYEELTDVNVNAYAGNPLNQDPTDGAGVPVGDTSVPWGTLLGGEPGQNTISSIGVGVAYRPFYELLMKLDFRMLSTEVGGSQQAIDVLQVNDQDFYHFVTSVVFSF